MPYVTSVERIGMEKGQREGRKEGTYTAVYTMIRNAKQKNLSDDMIAELTGLDVASVNKIWNNEPIDFPPHFLNPVHVPNQADGMR